MGNAAYSASRGESQRDTIPIGSATRGARQRRIPRAAMIAALGRNAEFVIGVDEAGCPRIYEVPALPGPDCQGGSSGISSVTSRGPVVGD